MVKELRTRYGLLLIGLVVFGLISCKPRDYGSTPTFSSKNFLQAVIEIPAGSDLVTYYCPVSLRFKVKMVDGKERKIDYLPIPVNQGFIPSTRLGNASEDGKMIEIMVVAEQLDIGSVVETIPLGMLVIKDEFQTFYKVLAIPVKPEQQVVFAETYQDLRINYSQLTEIIEDWYLNSGQYENPVLLGWEDDHVTRSFINKWLIH
jgi:inorganic pyrophosphatase